MNLTLDKLIYTVRDGAQERPLINVPALRIAAGERVALAGSSGAGKSTLLALLSGLLLPASGQVIWNGQDITRLHESARDAWRRNNVGLIFQDFRLLPGLSALENVLLPVTFGHARIPENLHARAAALLARLGLPRLRRKARLLSRGEMQRVALARALLFSPPLLLADEPTASLDQQNAALVADLLLEAAADLGCTLIVVSHDPALRQRMNREIIMEHGALTEAA